MKRFALLALLFAGCGLEQPPFECPEDPWLPAYIEDLRGSIYEIKSCPVGMPIQYNGKGCVPCTFIDQCGAAYEPAGCSPAEGVFCVSAETHCPAGFDTPVDQTVTQWSEQ